MKGYSIRYIPYSIPLMSVSIMARRSRPHDSEGALCKLSYVVVCATPLTRNLISLPALSLDGAPPTEFDRPDYPLLPASRGFGITLRKTLQTFEKVGVSFHGELRGDRRWLALSERWSGRRDGWEMLSVTFYTQARCLPPVG